MRRFFYAVVLCFLSGLFTGCAQTGPDNLASAQPEPPHKPDIILAKSFLQQPVMLVDRVVTTLPAGQSLGEYRFALTCAGPYGAVYWSDLRSKISTVQLRRAGQMALENAGYHTPANSDDLFEVRRLRQDADWLIAARVEGIDADLCRQTDWLFGSRQGISGQMALTVSWQIYDTGTETTVLRVKTSGIAPLPHPTSDGIAAMAETAFADAFDRLAHDHLDNLLRQQEQAPPAQDPPEQTLSNMAPPDLLPMPPVATVSREDANIKPVSYQQPVAEEAGVPWHDNLTEHADRLIAAILRHDGDGAPVLAIGGVAAQPVLVSMAKSRQKMINLRREDGQEITAEPGPLLDNMRLMTPRDAVPGALPLFGQRPRVGMAVAMITDINGRDRLEPILTSGLIARINSADKADRIIWLDVPRHVRDKAFFVLDASGNLLAVTRPDMAGGSRDGLVPAQLIDKNRLRQAASTLHAVAAAEPSP